ncbi:MAG: PepSY-associated TM helix domain-containing protein, partial [Burkholderiaceae bacterium]|nr:PepSY-associated TM helix domain-containing protein [Burkholderiaceae bacterium]
MSSTATLAQRKSLFWRIHFWAALIASPFAVIASLTGILYIFTPQIEAQLHGHLDVVQPVGNRQPLDAAIAAAQAAAPMGYQLRYADPALDADDSTRVVFAPLDKEAGKKMDKGGEHSGHNMSASPTTAVISAAPKSENADKASKGEPRIGGTERISRNVIVYVNPYTAQVLGQHGEMDRFGMWSKRLHSSLSQGDGWRWLIELSASWLMVMLATGIYLWWPRGSKKALPQAGVKGRPGWAQWHSFIGVALAIMCLVILTTGLTWSKYSGGEIRSLRDMSGQAPPTVPRGLKSTVLPDQAKLSWDAVYQNAKSKAPDVAMQISPPRNADGAWRLTNFDRGQPEKRFD